MVSDGDFFFIFTLKTLKIHTSIKAYQAKARFVIFT